MSNCHCPLKPSCASVSAPTGTKIVAESSTNLMDGLNLSVLSADHEGVVDGAWSSESKAGYPQSSSTSFSSTATRAPREMSFHSIDLNRDSSSSSTCSYKAKLPMVLEESESLSHREGSSIWDKSASSSLSSITSSSTSSTLAFLHRGASANGVRKAKKPHKRCKRKDRKDISLVSLLLLPLKKVRDAYMSCIMGFEGVGDLSGLAQGSTFAGSSKFFSDLPVSKADPRNYG